MYESKITLSMWYYIRGNIQEEPQENNFNEEKRLFYVAMTRAKGKLFLSWHRFNQYHSRKDISRLVQYIPREFIEEV